MANPAFSVSLQRNNGKRVSRETVQNNLAAIITRSVVGSRNSWQVLSGWRVNGPMESGDSYLYQTTVTYERKTTRKADDTRLTSEMNEIVKFLMETGRSGPFATYPWIITHASPKNWKAIDLKQNSDPTPSHGSDVTELVDFERALTLEELEIPDVLFRGTDEEIESHPAFEGIYGRAPHIRVMFSSIKTMQDTGGLRRNHCLLHGLPGCAKSSLFRGAQQVLGKGGYLAINANSATRAGIEAIFLRRLKQTGTPPVLFIEEIEKTQEAILTVWLSILDERAEVRKVTHGEANKAEARVLGFASANDKILFDRLMGGRPGHPGALSSRFTKPLYVPRPNRDMMRRILLRDIKLYGGMPEWADKCLEIADELGTNDPRIVLGFLDGGDRLLTGEYKDDILAIHRLEKADSANESFTIEE